MKNLLLVSSLMMSIAANAGGTKYICKEVINGGPKQTMVLTQVRDVEVTENVKERFVLEVFEGAEKTPRLSVKGYVKTEDVMFEFKSDDKKVSAMIYLDELEESGLTEGRKTTNFDCN